MMAHVTRAEFFLKAERKALGGKKLSGLELPLRKKKMQCGRWDWRKGTVQREFSLSL